MTTNYIEVLLEKYFDGETSLQEEQELKTYFMSKDVAQHLKIYQPLFGYYTKAKEDSFTKKVTLNSGKVYKKVGLSIAASIVFAASFYLFIKEEKPANTSKTLASSEYGTFNNPEEAFKETQKALALISTNVNKGVSSVSYIEHYEQSKNLIFKKQ